jgi:hypothetical protein
VTKENFIKFIPITFLIGFFAIQISEVAAATSAAGKGYANATVVTSQININDTNQSSLYEVSTEVTSSKNNKLSITYSISSEPNSILNVNYRTGEGGDFVGSQQDLVIEPKNAVGDKIELTIKTGDGKVYFDQNGKGALNITPEIGISGNQLKGTYRATYEVVVNY